MKVFKIGEKVKDEVKKYCKDNDMFMQEFVETSLLHLIKKDKHYFMREVLDELSKYITLKETDREVIDLMYVDFRYDEYKNSTSEKYIQFPDYPAIISPSVSVKRIQLDTEKYDDLNDAKKKITGEFLEKAKYFGLLNASNLPKNDEGKHMFECLTYDSIEVLVRRIFTKIDASSNYIATEGRVGPANLLMINPKWLKYKNLFSRLHVNNGIKYERNKEYVFEHIGTFGSIICVVVDSRVEPNQAIVSRKNNPDQPGIVGVYSLKNVGFNELDLKITDLGILPQKQFLTLNF